MKVADIHHYRKISETLSTSGQPTEAQLSSLAAEGCETVINLALHGDPRYSLPDERGAVEDLGLVYVHIPVEFNNPTEENLLSFFEAMDEHRHKRMHVHCAANMRVTAFLGLYHLIRCGKTHAAAFKPMFSVWEPNDIWSSFISKIIGKSADYRSTKNTT